MDSCGDGLQVERTEKEFWPNGLGDDGNSSLDSFLPVVVADAKLR